MTIIRAGVGMSLLVLYYYMRLRRARRCLDRARVRPPPLALPKEAGLISHLTEASAINNLTEMPPELLARAFAELPVCEVARASSLSRDFRNEIVEQALRMRAPALSGIDRPRWLQRRLHGGLTGHSDSCNNHGLSCSGGGSSSPSILAGPPSMLGSGFALPRSLDGCGPAALMVPTAVAEWAAELEADEALLSGRLVPGEYHFTMRTTDEAHVHSYAAYGQLCLYEGGEVRGSALEVAPDCLQV